MADRDYERRFRAFGAADDPDSRGVDFRLSTQPRQRGSGFSVPKGPRR